MTVRKARLESFSDFHDDLAYLTLRLVDGAMISVEFTPEQVYYINSRTAHMLVKREEKNAGCSSGG